MASLNHPVRPAPPVLEALIHTAALPGVGTIRLRRAVESRDGAEAGLRALARTVTAGLTVAEREKARGWAMRALETIYQERIHVLLPGAAAYPSALLRTDPPPCPLFACGRLELLDGPMVAVVGTRRATAYGREAARRVASGLVAAGVTVISGLAAGIDGVAHEAAGAARTIGVVGSGLDVFFPPRHRNLQRAIARDGLLLSEQLPGSPAYAHHFTRRNRIIASLALGVVVVEAPAKSGALNTAYLADSLSRYMFAVPGPIGSDRSAGANQLIRDGGTLVTSAREVLMKLGLPFPDEATSADPVPLDLEGQGLVIWRALECEPRHVDEIAAATGLDARRSLASLLALEVRGHARQLPGLRFARG